MVATLAIPSPALAADCSKTTVGTVALPDLASGTYKGELGGLYPGGTNAPPAAYADAGTRAAGAIVPLDAQGRPSYATTQLNPEPYAYESAFAVRALVERSIANPSARPWVGWGPYLWTDGARGRADSVVWTCEDAAQDGTHPSRSGQQKVATMLQRFFDMSPFTGWYPSTGAPVPTISPAPTRPPRPQPVVTPSPTEAALLEVEETPDISLVAGIEDQGELWPWVFGAVALVVFGAATFALTRRRT